ncbi:DUF3833 family protein [Alsobacter sp. R-9]
MSLTRRAAAMVAAVLIPLGLGPARAADIPGKAPSGKLVLEDFFRGNLVAEGTFTNTRDGSTRGLKVRMRGDWDGRTLTLVEDFVYSDGEKDRKTWRFTKVGDGVYTGTREDVIGTADVRQDGDAIRLTYTAKVTTKEGKSYNIRFADVLALTGPKTVLNTADLTAYWFFEVGKVRLEIRKV